MLQLDIQKHLPAFTLDVEFDVGAGLTVLFGPSGAGKTMTLQAVAGLLTPDAGHIAINGECVFDSTRRVNLPPQRRRVGYVMQDYALFPHLTVAENIAFGLTGHSAREKRRAVGEMLEMMRLERLGERRPDELSGGQRQRVALARALVTRPRVLLLDEPFAALDTPLRSRLRRDILDVRQHFDSPILFVTHDLEEAHMLADQMAVYDEGRVLQVGPPREILQRPANRTVARFTGARNIFSGRVVYAGDDGLRIATRRATLWAPPAPYAVGTLLDCCVRPEQVTLLHPERSASRPELEVQLAGRIVEELDHGTSHTLFFRIDDPSMAASPSEWTQDRPQDAGAVTNSSKDVEDFGVAAPGSIDLEIELSSHAYRRLGVIDQKQWTVTIKQSAVHVLGPAREPFFEGPAPQPEPRFE